MQRTFPNNSAPDIHLNLNVRGMRPSATVAIHEHCQELRRQGREVFRLGLGQSPFPVPAPVVEALQMSAWRNHYLAVQGLAELREAIAQYHARRHGISVDPSDVLIGPGSKELMFLLQLTYYGDLVIPVPAWVSYAPQARIVGRHVRLLRTRLEDGWKLAPERLEELCREDEGRPRLLILNYPSNPTGRTYTSSELQAVADVARRHRLIVLSDEIYGEVHHRGEHASLSRFYPEGTIVSSGLSKWCGAGGWRLGTFAFPPGLRWLLQAMAAVASETYTTTSGPIQWAAIRAFEAGPGIEAYLAQARRILEAVGAFVHAGLQGAGVRVLAPEGGFYVYPDFSALAEPLARRGVRSGSELCTALLEETGVAILPGEDFGSHPQDLCARLAFVDFDGLWALVQAEEIPLESPLGEDFVRQFCPRIVRAMERLGEWVVETCR